MLNIKVTAFWSLGQGGNEKKKSFGLVDDESDCTNCSELPNQMLKEEKKRPLHFIDAKTHR